MFFIGLETQVVVGIPVLVFFFSHATENDFSPFRAPFQVSIFHQLVKLLLGVILRLAWGSMIPFDFTLGSEERFLATWKSIY